MNNHVKNVKRISLSRLLITFFFLCCTNIMFAQSAKIDIAGSVTDKAGEPLIGVTVREEGTKNATVTDMDGAYTLKAVNAKGQLKFSYVGMTDKVIAVNGKKMNVVMSADEKILDQVVVIGYGSVKKSDLTGSVTSVEMDQLKATPSNSVEGLLQGRAAGLQVVNSSQSPGASSTVFVVAARSMVQTRHWWLSMVFLLAMLAT